MWKPDGTKLRGRLTEKKLLRIADGERSVLDRDEWKDILEVAMDLNGLK